MIPKRIIFTARSKYLIPPVGVRCLRAMRSLMPDYEHLFIDDEAGLKLIQRHYPEYETLYQAFPRNIQRADLLRLLAVHHFGGFYMDTDVFLFRRLDPLLCKQLVFPFEWRMTREQYLERHRKLPPSKDLLDQIGNYGFGARPGHWFLLDVARTISMRFSEVDPWDPSDAEVLYSTGPDALNAVLAQHHERLASELTVLPPGTNSLEPRAPWGPPSWNTFGEFGNHLTAGTWRTPGNYA